MTASARMTARAWAVLVAAALVLQAGPTSALILPWEVTVAEIEAGRLRNLAQRLNKQYLLYQFRLGDIRKSDLVETATQIDRIIESLEKGSPSHSIPSPWTDNVRAQISKVDGAWGPLRRIAVASPYEHVRVSREYAPQETRRNDPLLLLYFDELTATFVNESEALIAAYNFECQKTGLEVCSAAATSGYAAMLIERATKEAVYVIAGVEVPKNKKRLKATIETFREVRKANQESTFFAAALDPNRGVSAQAAGELLASLRSNWDEMEAELSILAAGDEENFDLQGLIEIQTLLVEKVERLTAALVRYASLAYGS